MAVASFVLLKAITSAKDFMLVLDVARYLFTPSLNSYCNTASSPEPASLVCFSSSTSTITAPLLFNTSMADLYKPTIPSCPVRNAFSIPMRFPFSALASKNFV